VVTTIARFLALLELFREGAVAFEQAEALSELTVRWSGSDEGEVAVGDEFDEGGQSGLERVEDADQPLGQPTDEGETAEPDAGGEHAGREQVEREPGEPGE
jgi:segregation and condensation protein A